MLEDSEQKHWDEGQIDNWVKAYVVLLFWQVQTDRHTQYLYLEYIRSKRTVGLLSHHHPLVI